MINTKQKGAVQCTQADLISSPITRNLRAKAFIGLVAHEACKHFPARTQIKPTPSWSERLAKLGVDEAEVVALTVRL